MSVVGIIPAAGRGTRLAPLPFSKELFPLGYQRLLINGKEQWRPKVVSQYIFEQMLFAGASKIFFVLGPGKHSIMEYYGDGHRWGVDIGYLFQEEPKGLPFALGLLRAWINKEDVVLFGMPDTLIHPKNLLAKMVEYHLKMGADLTLSTFRTSHPEKFGMVEIDKNGNIVANIDKPKQSSLEYMWGAACWSFEFVEILEKFVSNTSCLGEAVLSSAFQMAIEHKLKVIAFQCAGSEYCDIGTVDELNAAILRYSRFEDNDN